MRPLTLRRGTVAALSTGVFLLAGAIPAAAHVTVNPSTAAQGDYSKLTFRVPDEEADASTTKVELALPADQPVASVRVKPVPGWTVTTQMRKLSTPLKTGHGEITSVVSRLVWSGGKIQPGQFQEFDVSLGPLPENGDSMVFKALQTYDNGKVVRWIDPPAADGSEPEHPAPVVQLVKPTDDAGAMTAKDASTTAKDAGATAKDTGAKQAEAAPAAGSDGSARFLGGSALAVALLAVVLSLVTRVRARSERS
jgi:uncharacterized protein YcnI